MGKVRDELASALAESLNKKFGNAVHFLDGEQASPSTITQWISTGSPMLDLAIANKPNGGLPCGRIIEITGLEASGKSLLAAHALASCQKMGGVSVLIDTEYALNDEFLRAIGVDLNNLIAAHIESIEEVFEMVDSIIETVRKSDKDRPVAIVVDSIAGASTKNELEGNYDKTGYATDKAIIISQALRKITNMIGRQNICLICTNQLRQKMNVMFGDPWTTSGGKALAFHSSVRIRIKAISQIKITKNKKPMAIGIKTNAAVIKNRVGPPKRSADFDIFFDRGIDDTPSWLGILEELKIMTKAKKLYTLKEDAHGKLGTKPEAVRFGTPDWLKYLKDNKKKPVRRERVIFAAKDFYSLLDYKEYYNFFYNTICDFSIMKYSNSDSGADSLDPDDLIHLDENDEIIADE